MLFIMKKIGAILRYSALLVFFISGGQSAYSQSHDNNFQVSLLTYAPGDQLYSIFGHSAIRVKNSITNTDDVYNYGTFDFDDPSFYFGFVRGKLRYRLSKVPFDLVLQQVQLENRSLVETPLNLSFSEKTELDQLLRVNYLPENRVYLYDFLYNNCSTKIIDILKEGISDSLEYNQLAIPKKSFRKLLDHYSRQRPWTDIGIDFLMGIPADRRAKSAMISFLPDYLHLFIKNIRIKQEFGFEKSLAHSDIIHFNHQEQAIKPVIQPGPILWPIALILLISIVFGTYISGFFRIFEKSILIIFGSLGVIMIVLWIATDHYIFNFNTDILWANPLLLFLAFKKNFISRMKLTVILTYMTTAFALSGFITTMVVERNLNLTALAAMITISLIHKIYIFRKTNNDPFYHVS